MNEKYRYHYQTLKTLHASALTVCIQLKRRTSNKLLGPFGIRSLNISLMLLLLSSLLSNCHL